MGSDRAEFVTQYGGELGLVLHLVSDAIFTEPARFLATSHAARAPTYRYRFSIASPDELASVGGAVHSAEGAYTFDFGAADPELADQICDYWVSFAKTGDPNHGDAPVWPSAEDGALIDFTNDGPVPQKSDPWDARLDLVQTAVERLS
jgi:para-nitrobenzyl esterase